MDGLQPASPIPINTMDRRGGRLPRCTMRSPNHNCWQISLDESDRIRPILPVAQKAQPMAQPTWEETQSVVVGLPRVVWGMSTASTLLPSCRRRRGLVAAVGRFEGFDEAYGLAAEGLH